MENVTMILSLLCGVALFLYGMGEMGDGLKKVAGNQLELILYRLTNSPWKGFLLGTGVTCVIQSSSATTVMVVGFVNSGMMKVSQAIGVILGANIGTAITGWVVCLSYIDAGNLLSPALYHIILGNPVQVKMTLRRKVINKFKNASAFLLRDARHALA